MSRERTTRFVAMAAREVRVRARIRAGRSRRLPDFLVIGAQRCGTTSLFNYLAAHPDVRPSLGKELHFFTRHWRNGVIWYRAHFPPCTDAVATFEATPYYLFHPHAPYRAAEIVPSARLIVLLRDPVARAFSHYRHNVALGTEPLSFADALDAEPERVQPELERMVANPEYESRAVQRYSYVARGRYAEQIERWFEVYPRDRFLLLRTEDLEHDTANAYARTLAFLGLRPWTPPSFERLSQRSGRSQTADAVLASRLEREFRSHNERLTRLLGPDYEWSRSQ